MARQDSFTSYNYAGSKRSQLALEHFTEYDAFTGTDIKAFILPQGDHVARKELARRLESLEQSPTSIYQDLNSADVNESMTAYKIIEGDDPKSAAGLADDILPLVNLQSITISQFRAKSQVRALGHVNALGLARGSRTVAGTFILTEFGRDAFWDVLTAPIRDIGPGDTGDVKPDQMRPFDVLLLFAHEMGNLAIRHIYGLEVVTNGVVYSIQDYYSENTVSYIAHDISPLIPLTPAFNEREGKFNQAGSRIKLHNLVTNIRAEIVGQDFEYLKRARTPFR